MKLTKNKNLKTFIQNNPLTFNQLSHIFFQLLSTINFYHHNNITHHNITPYNILLTNKTNIQLTNFKLSIPYHNSKKHIILYNNYINHLHYSTPKILKKTPYNPLLSNI